jgi:uncharacterized protein (DUF58 family)
VRPTRTLHLPLPTSRAAWVAAATAVPVLAGAFVPAIGWVGLALLGVALIAIVVDWAALPRARDLDVVRVERPVLSHGALEVLAVDVRGRRGAFLRVVDDVPEGLERVADPPPRPFRAGGTERFATTVRAMRRGTASLGAVHVRVRGPWALAERQLRVDLPIELRVLPGVRAVAQSARWLRGRRLERGLRRTRQRGEGTSFESLREYARGDDPRHLDWKASAKRAKLITRHHEVERNQSVILMVDCGRWMTSEIEGLSRLDRVLETCVLLAHVAASRDDRVGLLAFADEVLAYVPPTKGREAVAAILEATAEIEPRLVESDYVGAFAALAARHRKRSLVVLFTDVLGSDVSRAVVEECLRAVRRHLPLAVTLRDAGLEALASDVPANSSAAYRQAAAEELLLEREQAFAVMRRAGIQLVDVPARSLGPAVVERYLDIKSRMLV